MLDPAGRAATVARLGQASFDVLVVGGGVTGCGAALDAATRGLDVALVEARDLAAGTSSRSSKLVHGGLRYLEQLDFPLVFEALRERSLILERLCPHLARPVPFLLPLTHRGWERAYLGAGVLLYDTIGGRRGLPRHRHLSKRQALAAFPALRPDSLVGAIEFWDGQVDDARHTLFLARTAARYGAAVATSVSVTGLVREGGAVVGARCVDLETGASFDVRARRTVSAAGVWTDTVRDLAGDAGGGLRVRASKGVHLLVPRDRIRATTGLIARTERSVLFVIPWGDDHWIVGTTDTDWRLDLDHPAATRADLDYLLAEVNSHLVEPLGHSDIVGVYAGLRPLLAGESDSTSTLSREHAVSRPAPGLVSVAGGKYTTYRVMARDAIDAAVADLGHPVPGSCTQRVALLGADGFAAAWNSRQATARRRRMALPTLERLLRRYGSLTDELLDAVDAEPSLGHPVAGAEGYLGVEVVYAVTHEGALHLEDVLARRTRIAIETPDRGLAAADAVAGLMAGPLRWSPAQARAEVDTYRAQVDAELAAEGQAGDTDAERTLRQAPDPRPSPTSAGESAARSG